MLVEFDLALQVGDVHFKRHDAVQHFFLVRMVKSTPLIGLSWLVITNELFEQSVFGGFAF
jgi:hypothetical protein